MKRYLLLEASYIASTLLAAGSVVTEEDLGEAVPGRALVEVDENHQPVTDEGRKALIASGVVPAGITQVAPINPHAPNPTRPQAIPPRSVAEPALATDRGYVPAQGVESDAANATRTEQTDKMIERHADSLAAASSATATVEPDAPQRRSASASSSSTDSSGSTGASGANSEPGPLDHSIVDLTAHLENVSDRGELDALRAAEVGGKSRKGALDAIDARIAALGDTSGSGSGSSS